MEVSQAQLSFILYRSQNQLEMKQCALFKLNPTLQKHPIKFQLQSIKMHSPTNIPASPPPADIVHQTIKHHAFSNAQRLKKLTPLHEVLHELFAVLFIEDLELFEQFGGHFFGLVVFVIVFPIVVRGLIFGLILFERVIFSNVLAENEEEFLESRRLADPADPQQKDRQMGVLQRQASFGIILNQLLDVHQAEFIHHFLLRSHRVPQLPLQQNHYHIYRYYSIFYQRIVSSFFSLQRKSTFLLFQRRALTIQSEHLMGSSQGVRMTLLTEQWVCPVSL